MRLRDIISGWLPKSDAAQRRARIAPLPRSLRASRIVIFRELKVRRAAAADGGAEKPSADADHYSATEQALVERFETKARDLERIARNVVEYARDEIDGMAPTRIDVESQTKNARAQLNEALIAELDRYEAAAINARRKEKALAAFKIRHDRAEDARYKDEPVFTVGLLAAVIALESFANATMFGQASDAGLIGGWSVAVIVSLVNALVLGFLMIGFFGIRNAVHVNVGRRIVGWNLIGFGMSLTVLFSLLVAHYRDALEADPDADWREAVMALIERWWALDTLEAVALFIIGVGITALGAWKGHAGLWDVYPGYDLVARDHRTAEIEREDARQSLRDAAADVVDAALEECRIRLEQGETALKRARELRRRANDLKTEVSNSAVALRNEASRLISLYREVNQQIRETPSPAHFRIAEAFSIEVVSFEPVTEAFCDLQARIEDNERAFKELETHLVDLSSERIASVESDADKARRRAEKSADTELTANRPEPA
ncbi:MAG: hypothetical protein ACLFQ5_12300 [Oceanicaulis sp.]